MPKKLEENFENNHKKRQKIVYLSNHLKIPKLLPGTQSLLANNRTCKLRIDIT